MSQVNTELGYSSNATISLNQTAVRTLAGVPSGTISMNNLRGKSNAFAFTISSNQTNANLRTLAVAAGWDQTKKVAATINSGVYISSNSTGTPALTVTGSFPNGVELINNGLIIGMGGSGGGQTIVGFGPGVDGNAGGAALSTSVALSVNNAGTIGGGGGGGGASGATYNFDVENQQGWLQGGGGGGRSSAAANSAGVLPRTEQETARRELSVPQGRVVWLLRMYMDRMAQGALEEREATGDQQALLEL